MIRRYKTAKRRTPPKRVNHQRAVSETLRAYGPPARRQWVASLVCAVHPQSLFDTSGARLCDGRYSENAHIRGGGKGRKGDGADVIPLCGKHHRELHRIGVVSFQLRYRINFTSVARLVQDGWLDRQGRT